MSLDQHATRLEEAVELMTGRDAKDLAHIEGSQRSGLLSAYVEGVRRLTVGAGARELIGERDGDAHGYGIGGMGHLGIQGGTLVAEAATMQPLAHDKRRHPQGPIQVVG